MRKYILFAISLMFIACNEKNVSEPELNYIIDKIEPASSFIGDTVNIYGYDFGDVIFSSNLILPPNIEILSEDVLLWQNQKISFVVPENAVSGEISVIVQDSLIGTVFLEISKIPPYKTVSVNSGSFSMGSESGSEDELPVHTVNISNSLEVFEKEVTVRMFKNVMGYVPNGNDDINLPVRNVKWIEAVKFCNELSKIEELDTCYTITESFAEWDDSKDGWRLPTEAEWEFLARSNNNFDFPNNGELTDYGWFSQNSGLKLHPGARKNANENKIFDMNGNVWEWCWDFYQREYYNLSPDTDPKGPDTGETHVKRGGSAIEGSYFSRNSARKSSENTISYTGIRIVRNINQ